MEGFLNCSDHRRFEFEVDNRFSCETVWRALWFNASWGGEFFGGEETVKGVEEDFVDCEEEHVDLPGDICVLPWRYVLNIILSGKEYKERGGDGGVQEVKGVNQGTCGWESIDVFEEGGTDVSAVTDWVLCACEDLYLIWGKRRCECIDGKEWLETWFFKYWSWGLYLSDVRISNWRYW